MDMRFDYVCVLQPDGGVARDQYVGVTGAFITHIGPDKPDGQPGRVINARDRLMTPGFVNTHSHVPMTLLRGWGEELPLQRWLEERIFPVEARMGDDDIEAGALLGIAEMIACGTTSFSDMYNNCDVIARAVGKSGMKANIARALLFFGDGFDANTDQRVREAEQLFAGYHGAFGGRVSIDWSVHAEYTSTPELVRWAGQRAVELGARMHVHVSETLSEHEQCVQRRGVTPTAYLAGLGLFDAPSIAAHCVHITDADMDILREHGVTVAHCPSSNLKLGSGIAPIASMLGRDVCVALGTDGAASNNNLNIPEELHLAALLQKGALREPTVLPAARVMHMASRAGALAQGRDDTGELRVGMRADLALWSLEAPHMRPEHNLLANLVYSAQAADVRMTMVDGRVLYEDGEHKTLDVERICAAVKSRTGVLF